MTQSEKDIKLIDAAKAGDLESVIDALKDGANVNAPDEDCRTPLLWATFFGYSNIAKKLIKSGANCNISIGGATPLHNAILRGLTEVVEMLVKVPGILLEIRDNDGDTPLHKATLRGQYDIVVALINARAKVNATGNGCATPLHLAAMNGFVWIAKALLKANADKEAIIYYGDTPLQVALRFKHYEIALLLSRDTLSTEEGDWKVVMENGKGIYIIECDGLWHIVAYSPSYGFRSILPSDGQDIYGSKPTCVPGRSYNDAMIQWQRHIKINHSA